MCNKSCVNTVKPTKRAVNDEMCACTCYTMKCMVKVSWGPRPDLYFCDTPPHFAHRPGAEAKCLRGGPWRTHRPLVYDAGLRGHYSSLPPCFAAVWSAPDGGGPAAPWCRAGPRRCCRPFG